MRIARTDLKQLRLPAVAAALLVALGAAAVGASRNYLAQAEATFTASQAQRVAAQTKMSKASGEEREIRDNLVFFRRMQDQGMIGSENRLDWIDSIARIKTARRLFEIKYSIEAQRPLDYPGITATGAMDFVVSRMKLDMMLLHEEDLLNFLSDLQGAGNSLASVRRCAMSRMDRGNPAAGQALQPRLRAECVIDLINLKEGKSA